MPTETEQVQYGVRYPDGTEDWNTRSWFGHLETAQTRADFREQYELRLRQYGMPVMDVVFLSRTVFVRVGDAEVIDDDA